MGQNQANELMFSCLTWNQPADNRNNDSVLFARRGDASARHRTKSLASTITRELAAFWNTYCHHFPFTARKLRHKEVHELPQRYIVNKFNSTPKTTLLTTSHASPERSLKLPAFYHVSCEKERPRRLPCSLPVRWPRPQLPVRARCCRCRSCSHSPLPSNLGREEE